jgi:hypothetical protein
MNGPRWQDPLMTAVGMLVFFASWLATSISGEPAISASASWTLVSTGAAIGC